MNLLVLGDLHIAKWPKLIPQNYSPWASIFRQVHEYAQEHGVDNIVQLGDVFDHVNPTDESRFFLIDTLVQSSLNWHFQYGNHDYENNEINSFNYFRQLQHSLGVLKSAHFMIEPTLKIIEKQSMLFLPWPHINTRLCSKLDKPSLVFAHVPVPGSKADSGMLLKNVQHKPKWDRNHWFIGDLHTRQKGESWEYPGAPLQLNYGDNRARYFLHLTGSFPFKRKYIKLTNPYNLETVQVLEKDAENSNAILARLRNRTENTYTKIKLASSLYKTGVSHAFEEFPRLFVETVGKKDNTETGKEEVAVTENSSAIRQDLTIKRLKQKEYSAEKIAKALNLVTGLESNLRRCP